MSNVVYLNAPSPQERRAGSIGALIRSFASCRRGTEDVFWLKENAELLNILECTGQEVPEALLEPYAAFYENIAERLAFFPQYYRFILSIALDLEAQGFGDGRAESLCEWAVACDLAGGETSDIQRLEANRLMQRRGYAPIADINAAEARLRDFISRPERFALPNKKAAFELTHIVFYLSEYGRKDPEIGQTALRSLKNAGILAFLDKNIDLLAEICVAMRYAGHNPSAIWEDWIAKKVRDFEVREHEAGVLGTTPITDQYHEFLTSSWLLGAKGERMFTQVPIQRRPHDARLSFHRETGARGALREMSMELFRMGAARNTSWDYMRGRFDGALSREAAERLAAAEQSTEEFESFFADFARVSRAGGKC